MRVLAIIVVISAVCCLERDGSVAQRGSPTIALVGGLVLPSPNAAPIEEGTIVVGVEGIVTVGSRDAVTIPPGAMTIDCRGLSIVAGFQNSHVHLTEPHWADAATQPAPRLTGQLQTMLTSHGFTTVVDTGSLLQNTAVLRRRIEAGEVSGPRILTAGVPLYPPDGVPFYLKDGSVSPDLLKLLPQPSTVEEAAAVVNQNIDGGADIIKLFTGSWVSRQQVLPMPADVAAAAVRGAHQRGRLVFAHTSSPAGLEVTLSAGVDVIAHALDDTRGLTAEHLRRMKQQNVALIPTLTLFSEAPNAAAIVREVADYAALSGDILFGTDVGYHQMYEPRREYELMNQAGMTWRQILASLTTIPAGRFGNAARRGQVASGMESDLVVLGTDPRSDPLAFADVRYTIRSGQVIYQRTANR
jgi:imidazolonepropionase-like amidohydrolase